MADVRVTQLPTLALPDDTDVLHAVDVSADKDSQLTIAALKAALGASAGPGTPGTPGTAATISVGSTTTGAPGSQASVSNTGTSSAAVLAFTIPRGDKGEKGDKGDPGSAAALPPASAGTLGGVKIGSGISVTADGTISAAAQAGTGTDLSYDPATRALTSSTGADVTLPEATDQVAGLMSTAQVGNLGAAINRTNSLQEQVENLFDASPQPWAAGAYIAGAVVSKDGKFYVAARDAVAADVPGASNKWRDLTLEAIEEKAHNAFTHRVPDWGAATDGQVLTVVIAGTDPVWESPAVLFYGSTTPPANPAAGDPWIDDTVADKPVLKMWNGTAWIAVGGAAGGLPDFATLAALP